MRMRISTLAKTEQRLYIKCIRIGIKLNLELSKIDKFPYL